MFKKEKFGGGKNMQTDFRTVINEIGEIASLGYFEADLLTGNWSGSENIMNILGLNPDVVYTNEDLRDFIHSDDKDDVISYFNKCLKSGSRFDCEYRWVIPGGKTLVIMTKSKIIRNNENIPVKIIGLKQDITSVKFNESKLKELKESNKRKNEILGTVAHDLKSPLSSIMGMTEMLSENASSYQIDLIKYIQEALNTATDIINGLIEIAELEEGSELLHCTITDINSIISESVHHFMIRAEKKQIEIRTKLCDNATASADAVKFSRIIDNLLLNAIKFTNTGGMIIVSSYYTPGYLNISIEDNGIGIDTKIIPELFNKFSKARRRGTSGEKSTGLGLSIVRELIDLHHGKIDVESEVNRGTKFTLMFPAGFNK